MIRNPIIQAVLGSIGRHWLGTLLGLLVGRGWMKPEEAAGIVPLLSNEMLSDLIVSLFVAVPTAAISVRLRLRAKMKTALALQLPKDTSEEHVDVLIKRTPFRQRWAAFFSGDPCRILHWRRKERHA